MTTGKRSVRQRGKVRQRTPQRDYKAEYQRRIARGIAKGLSRSQSRGHARAGERPKARNPIKIDPNRPEERAIKLMKSGSSLKSAAMSEGLNQERLRRYLKENTDAKRIGRKWQIEDKRPRQFPFYSNGKLVSPLLGPSQVSKAAVYMHAVREFLPSGDAGLLTPFVAEGARDLSGMFHLFETDENTLYELDSTGELSFPEFYRIIA